MAEEEEKGKFGYHFGKPDMERLGLFTEMPYMNGKGYISPFEPPDLIKGKNIIGQGSKLKAGTADCYFDKEFKRIFEGESIKGRGRKIEPMKWKPVSKYPFMPVGPTKWHSSPGDWYGTFDISFPYMSAKPKKTGKYKSEGKNFLTKPGKKGGSGYIDIGICKYPEHSKDRWGLEPKYKQYGKMLDGPMITSHYPDAYFEPNPYRLPPSIPFGKTYVKPKDKGLPCLGPGKIQPAGPGKKLGGCKCGGFAKYPEHSTDKYFTVWHLDRPKKLVGKKWNPHSTGLKSKFTCSVVDENLKFKLNQRTLNTFEPTYIKYLMS